AAWITTAARHKAIDLLRRRRVRRGPALEDVADPADRRALEALAVLEDRFDSSLHDDRLPPTFPCCHPALNQEAQVALTPRALGLLALLLLHDSRRAARTNAAGEIVLLEDQDRALWDREQIAEGRATLARALAERRRGPYQVQAAIAALHAEAERPGATDWPQ